MVAHNCPANSGHEVPLVELWGLIPVLGLASSWGSWCASCGAVWQGDLQLVPPATAQEVYTRDLEAFGRGSLN